MGGREGAALKIAHLQVLMGLKQEKSCDTNCEQLILMYILTPHMYIRYSSFSSLHAVPRIGRMVYGGIVVV